MSAIGMQVKAEISKLETELAQIEQKGKELKKRLRAHRKALELLDGAEKQRSGMRSGINESKTDG